MAKTGAREAGTREGIWEESREIGCCAEPNQRRQRAEVTNHNFYQNNYSMCKMESKLTQECRTLVGEGSKEGFILNHASPFSTSPKRTVFSWIDHF